MLRVDGRRIRLSSVLFAAAASALGAVIEEWGVTAGCAIVLTGTLRYFVPSYETISSLAVARCRGSYDGFDGYYGIFARFSFDTYSHRG